MPDLASRPLVVGHRGAPDRFPEHTAAAFVAALDQGADVIEVDVQACRDGVLVARHDAALGLTTDAAQRVDLADACSVRRVDHSDLVDWWVDELPADIVTSLRARERWPNIRRDSAAHDGVHPVLRLVDVLRLATRAADHRSRPVGVAVEMKDVGELSRRGLDVVSALVADLAATGLPTPATPVWAMAFEAEPLARLHAWRRSGRAPDVHLVQLIEVTGPADRAGWDAVAARAEVVGLSIDLALASAGARDAPGTLAGAAASGLDVWTWTLRAENAFLPTPLRRGVHGGEHGDLAIQVHEAVSSGVVGLVTDQPGLVRGALS